MQILPLSKLKSGRKARVANISGGEGFRRRLMSMGIYSGREIKKLSHFALRGPVTVQAGRAVFALGHGMAGKIMVETE